MKVRNKEILQSYIMTTAKYDYSVDEKRILLQLVEMWQYMIEGVDLKHWNGRIDKRLFGDYKVEVPLSYFVPDNQTNYKRIKAALKALNDKSFEYEDKERNWEIIRIIEMPKIKKGEMVSFIVTEKMAYCFLNFAKGYRKFELERALSFNSVYSMRFYELLSGQKERLSYSIDKLKDMFFLQKKYKREDDFLKRIVEYAKKELDEKSDISFDYTVEKKRGTSNILHIYPKRIGINIDDDLETKRLGKQLSITTYLSKNDVNYLIENFNLTQKGIKNNHDLFIQAKKLYGNNFISLLGQIKTNALRNNAKNKTGYLINAIKKELNQL